MATNRFKKIFLTTALIMTMAVPGTARADWGPADLARAIVSIVLQGYFIPILTRMHAETDANAQIVGMKTAMANKVVAESIAEYREASEHKRQATRIQESLRQPETTCSSLAQASVGPKVDIAVKAAIQAQSSASANQKRGLPAQTAGGKSVEEVPIQVNANTTQSIIKKYDYVMSNFCSQAEADAGRCNGYKPAAKYQGGDIRAELLFGDESGNDTASADQKAAVDAYIENIVESMPPELLRNPEWDKTPEGRKYVLMVRQYAAFMSLSRYSLRAIQLNHMPIDGLGDATGVTQDPRFVDRKNISRMEATDLFIKSKWSPAAIKDMATQTEPVAILRNIAMMNAHRMWMEYQNLAANERQEALLSGQLALAARQSLAGPLDKQRVTATGRGNSAGG